MIKIPHWNYETERIEYIDAIDPDDVDTSQKETWRFNRNEKIREKRTEDKELDNLLKKKGIRSVEDQQKIKKLQEQRDKKGHIY